MYQESKDFTVECQEKIRQMALKDNPQCEIQFDEWSDDNDEDMDDDDGDSSADIDENDDNDFDDDDGHDWEAKYIVIFFLNNLSWLYFKHFDFLEIKIKNKLFISCLYLFTFYSKTVTVSYYHFIHNGFETFSKILAFKKVFKPTLNFSHRSMASNNSHYLMFLKNTLI